MQLCYHERGSKDSKGIELEEGGEANRAVSEENDGEFEVMTFREENSLEVPEEFPLSLTIQAVSLFLAWLVM